jgi:hypothetical protein
MTTAKTAYVECRSQQADKIDELSEGDNEFLINTLTAIEDILTYQARLHAEEIAREINEGKS